MVHLIVDTNDFDLEGLVMGVGRLDAMDNQPGTGVIGSIIDAYEQVLSNLETHADGYPSAEYLRSIVAVGHVKARMANVGNGKDNDGSNLIIEVVDKDDPRPVWINAWGGANTIAQAFWTVNSTRTPEEIAAFVHKVRIYDIMGQDDAGAYMTHTFPELFYIRIQDIYGWPPSDSWVSTNVQRNHGPLGAEYPNKRWVTEGDSPAFLHVWATGLNNPDKVDQGGWGGRFNATKKKNISVFDGPRNSGVDESPYHDYYMYGDAPEGMDAINRWKQHIYNNLAARMDWCAKSNFADANHHPLAVVNGDSTRQILEMTVSAGSEVTLDTDGSSDPDSDNLSYSWQPYKEPSSYNGNVSIQGGTSETAKIAVPSDAGGKNIHIILIIHDDGEPSLHAYRRVILNVE